VTSNLKTTPRYAPSVFVLGPNQHLHIGKGRLHAFRKMSNYDLPENDCHYELRNDVKKKMGDRWSTKALTAVSIAFDWYGIMETFCKPP
jgi:hypothetical protein